MINSIIKLVISESSKKEFIGTGTFIKYKDKILLATAAHCIYNFEKKIKAKKIKAVYRSGNFTKSILVKDVFFYDDWYKNGLLSYDFAICTLCNVPHSPKYIYSVGTDIYLKIASGSKIKMIGLDQGFLFDKEIRFLGSPNFDLLESNNLIGGAIRMNAGSSGGPVTITNNKGLEKQVGVISSTLLEYPDYTWGVLWNQKVIPLLEKAVSKNG